MDSKIAFVDLDAPRVLGECADFVNEVSMLEQMMVDRGHMLLKSPKCHPELAGCGIEYSWGKIKWEFRRHTNDGVADHLHDNIVKAMERGMTLERSWKFERRTRDYRRSYLEFTASGKDITHKGLEDMRKSYSTHRNIAEIERVFIGSVI